MLGLFIDVRVLKGLASHALLLAVFVDELHMHRRRVCGEIDVEDVGPTIDRYFLRRIPVGPHDGGVGGQLVFCQQQIGRPHTRTLAYWQGAGDSIIGDSGAESLDALAPRAKETLEVFPPVACDEVTKHLDLWPDRRDKGFFVDARTKVVG